MIQPRLYSTNSQQQPPQGALYCKVKTLFEDELGNSGKKKLIFNRKTHPAVPGSVNAAICHDWLGVRGARHDVEAQCTKLNMTM